MKEEEKISFILETLYGTQGKLSDSKTIHELLALKDPTGIEGIAYIIKYMEAKGLITIANTLGYGLVYKLTPRGIEIIHENVTYTNYLKKEKSIFKGFKTLDVVSLVIGVIGLTWGIFQDISSREKDDEIKQLKISNTEQENYIKEMRIKLTEKEALIDVYNRSNPPTAKTDK